jgi:pimeloyl-ACP methyl ester carboxylesterase
MPPPDRRETRITTVDGHVVTYTEYGDPDGAPVVFLHGTPGSRLLGGVFDGHAREAGVRVLAPDRPGYGRSDPRESWTFTDASEFVAGVIDDAGVSCAGVVGFSGGGPHALAVAATHPERVTSVDLVATATPPSLHSETPFVQRLLGRLAESTPRLLSGLLRGQAWLASRASPETTVAQYTTDDAADVPDDVAALVKRDFLEAVGDQRTGVVTESALLAQEWSFTPADVETRVRLWHGKRDENAPLDGAKRLADRLPNSDLQVFETDHLRTLLSSRQSVLERHASTEQTETGGRQKSRVSRGVGRR